MPLYDFQCQSCKVNFEVTATFPEYSAMIKEKTVKCKECGSAKVVRVFPASDAKASTPSKKSGGSCCAGGKCC